MISDCRPCTRNTPCHANIFVLSPDLAPWQTVNLNTTHMNSMQAIFSSMSVSMGIAMHNASTNQHNGQNIANACLSVCCRLILSKGAG